MDQTSTPPPYTQTAEPSASSSIQPVPQAIPPPHESSSMADAKQSYYNQAPEGHPAQQPQPQPQSSYVEPQPGDAQPQPQPGYSQPNAGAPNPQQEKPRPQGPLTPLDRLNLTPALVDCPVCGERQVTRTEFESGNTTYGWAAGLCIVVGLGCIPFCINGTKNVVHYCGHEGTRLATWHRSGRTDVHVVPRT